MSKTIITAVIAAALSMAAVAPAIAADAAPTRVINVAGVNFRDPASAQAFYVRLAETAAAVCNSGSNNTVLIQEDRECARETLAQAVARLDRPTLTALHNNEKATTQFAAR